MPFVRLQFRRGSASQWTSANPILADGELAIESDTNKFKIGNGVASWTLLPYGGLVGPAGSIDSIVPIDISFNGNIFVGRDVSFGGKLTVRNDVSFNTELRVGGNINVRSGAASTSTSTGALIVAGGVGVGGNLILGADASFNGNATFANLPYFNGIASAPASNQLVTKSYVDVNGGTILLGSNNTWIANNIFNGNLIANGDASFNDNLSVHSDSSFNNRLYVGKQIGVGVTANAAYALDVFGNINMTGNLFLNNKLFSITSADISLNANLMVGADASFNGNVFLSKTLNYKKTVLTGAATGSPTAIVAATPIVEITGTGAPTAYFTLANGSYAGQTLTINSATNGGGSGLYVNSTGGTNIIFNGSNCSQMRFSSAFQTVNLLWSADVSQWIVTSWQGVNFSGVSMNFGTYTSGDITLGSAGKVNINPGVGGMIVGSDSSFNGNLLVSVGKLIGVGVTANPSYALNVGGNINLTGNLFTNGVLFSAFDNSKDISLNANLTVARDSSFNANLHIGNRLTVAGGDVSLNQRLTVGGADSSFNGNVYVGGFLSVNGYVNADSYTEKFVNIASSSGTYTANFNNGTILYVNSFSGSSTPTLSITNLPTTLNQSYVFTVVYSGAPTSTYFSALNINGASVPMNGTVSLTAATSYYIHQFCIFLTDATSIGINFVLQNFNSSAPVSLVSPSINGNLSLTGNINLTGGNIYQNGTLFVGGGGGSIGPNLYLGGDLSFNGKMYGNGDVSFNQRIFVGSDASINANVNVGGNINFQGNLYQNGVLFTGSSTSGTSLTLSGVLTVNNATQSTSKTTGAVIVVGGAGVGGNVEVGGNVDIASAIESTSKTTGALVVGGGAGVGSNLYVGNNIEMVGIGTFRVSNTVINKKLVLYESVYNSSNASTSFYGFGVNAGTLRYQVDQASSVHKFYSGTIDGIIQCGDITSTGNVRINNATGSTSTTTGALVVTGGIGCGEDIFAAGIVSVGSATESTSKTTGALIVGGGVGVGGNVQVGGNVKIISTIASTNSSTGSLIVGGGVGIDGNLNTNNNITTSGVITTTNNTSSTSSSTGAVIVNGGIGVGGNIQVAGVVRTTFSTPSTSTTTGALIVGGGAGVAGNVYVGGNLVVTGTTALTGIPTAPTAATTTNTTQIATTAFVQTEISALVASAPGTLNTLNELALALGSDANFSTTVTNSIATKAPIASPTFTGTVSTPALSVTDATPSTSSITGALLVSGGVGVGGNVSVGGNINFVGNLFQNGTLFTGGGGGSSTTGTTLALSGATQSTSPITGAFTVVGGAGIGGNVEIGGNVDIASTRASTSSTTGALTVAGGVGIAGTSYIAGIVNITNSTQPGGTPASGALVVSGGVGIGGGLITGGQIWIQATGVSTSTSSGALQIQGTNAGIGVAGNIYAGGTINASLFNSTSDYRIKQNVRSICDDPSFNVDVLRPITYINSRAGKQDIGFIAHEVGEHYPYLVNGEKDGEHMQSLNYTGIIGILVKEIQELKKETQELKKRVFDLEHRLP